MKKLMFEINDIKRIMGLNLLMEGSILKFLGLGTNPVHEKFNKNLTDDIVRKYGLTDANANFITTKADLETRYNEIIEKDPTTRTTTDEKFIKDVHEKVLNDVDLDNIAKFAKKEKDTILDDGGKMEFDKELKKLFHDEQAKKIFESRRKLDDAEKEPKKDNTEKKLVWYSKDSFLGGVLNKATIFILAIMTIRLLPWITKQFAESSFGVGKTLADFGKRIYGQTGLVGASGDVLYGKLIDNDVLPDYTFDEMSNILGLDNNAKNKINTYAEGLYNYEHKNWYSNITDSDLSNFIKNTSEESGLLVILINKKFKENYGTSITSWLTKDDVEGGDFEKDSLAKLITENCSPNFYLLPNLSATPQIGNVQQITKNYLQIEEDIKNPIILKNGKFEKLTGTTEIFGEQIGDANLNSLINEGYGYFSDYLELWTEKSVQELYSNTEEKLSKIGKATKDIKNTIGTILETVLPLKLDVYEAEEFVESKMVENNFYFGGSALITYNALKLKYEKPPVKRDEIKPEPKKKQQGGTQQKTVIKKDETTGQIEIESVVGLAKLLIDSDSKKKVKQKITEQTQSWNWMYAVFQDNMDDKKSDWWSGTSVNRNPSVYGNAADPKTNEVMSKKITDKKFSNDDDWVIENIFFELFKNKFEFQKEDNSYFSLTTINDVLKNNFKKYLGLKFRLEPAFYLGVMTIPQYKNLIKGLKVDEVTYKELEKYKDSINNYM